METETIEAPKPKRVRTAKPKVIAPIVPKYINTCSMQPLNEGRSKGLAYAFLKRDGDTYNGIQPFSPCKDYLSDTVWTEITGKPCSFYGYHAKPNGCLADGLGYIAMGIRGIRPYSQRDTSVDYEGIVDDRKELALGYPLAEDMCNFIEETLKIDGRTTIVPMDVEGMYLITLPKWWIENHVRTSLCTMLIRAAYHGWNRSNPKPWDNLAVVADGSDQYIMSNVVPKVKQLLEGWRIEFDEKTCSDPHNNGIYSYQMLSPLKP